MAFGDDLRIAITAEVRLGVCCNTSFSILALAALVPILRCILVVVVVLYYAFYRCSFKQVHMEDYMCFTVIGIILMHTSFRVYMCVPSIHTVNEMAYTNFSSCPLPR